MHGPATAHCQHVSQSAGAVQSSPPLDDSGESLPSLLVGAVPLSASLVDALAVDAVVPPLESVPLSSVAGIVVVPAIVVPTVVVVNGEPSSVESEPQAASSTSTTTRRMLRS